MAELAKSIRQWLGLAAALPQRTRQQAARDQLHGHINESLLEPFLRRTVTPEQHATVVGHLNACDSCREAIALVLLAQEDPSAAAELELKRKEMARVHEPWHRVAIRWTVIVLACIIILAILFLLPETYDPESRVGQWINSQTETLSSKASESETSVGAMIATRMTREESQPSERGRPGGWFSSTVSDSGSRRSSPPPMEVPLPQRRERSSAPQSSTADDGRGLWFFGSEDKPEKAEQPVWDPVLAARRKAAQPPSENLRRAPAKRRLVVSPDGSLRRTLDGGVTWDVLDVGQNVMFHAVALSGTTVWAAGANGALYRSPDAAEHWQSVSVRYGGVPLTADIKHIQFNDPQHGSFQTSDGHVWITVDGGNKWVLSSSGNSR